MRDVSKDFPLLSVPEDGKRLIYLDNGATTQKPVQVLKAVEDYYRESNANPHRGVYELAQRATDAHEGARTAVANFLNAAEDAEIVFTQNASEALNLVAYSYGLHFVKAGDEIAVAISEHHSNLVPWQRVAEATGAALVWLEPDADGRITVEECRKKLTAKTRVVAVAQVSNVLGMANPVKEIAALAHGLGAVVVADTTQSVPHMPVDVRDLDVDFACGSAHKMYGPMGVGFLYGKRALLEAMPPFLSGGDMIQSVHTTGTTYAELPWKFEAGTRNVGGEIGFQAAIEYVNAIGWPELLAHEAALMERLVEGLKQFPYVKLYGAPTAKGRHGVAAFNIDEVHPHDVATILDANGVAIRAGHHCAQPLMDFLGIGSCCRASLGVYNTAADVDTLLAAIPETRRVMGLGA